MDFARKELEKYGWTDGKGLGKKENGISEPLKAKLKRSVAGIGHDAAADFTEHWWSQLYNKAAKNVEVEEKNGKTKKIKTKSDQFKITNSSYHLNKKSDYNDHQEEYSDFFVKTAVLTNGGSKVEKVRESESEGEEETKDNIKLTDEELFAACQGRTAHKGARHGLKALGKLARIERQEEMLLAQSKYNGYSHAKRHRIDEQIVSEQDLDVMENMNISTEEDCIDVKKKKKKKRKHCNETKVNNFSDPIVPLPEDETEEKICEMNIKKSKKLKNKMKLIESAVQSSLEENDEEMAEKSFDTEVNSKVKKCKRKRKQEKDESDPSESKTKKKQTFELTDEVMDYEVRQIVNSKRKVKKNKKKKNLSDDS